MSPLLSFSKDDSVWRYEKEMDCDWRAFPEPGKYPYQIHRYTVMDIDGHQFEIDAVYSKTGGRCGSRYQPCATWTGRL